MKQFNKSDVRGVYFRLKDKGLFYTTNHLKQEIERAKVSTLQYKHILPAMEQTLELLKEINRRRDDLLVERIVRSGPVNHGESWGDFYDCFPKKDDVEVKKLFNELQENTSYGFFLEL